MNIGLYDVDDCEEIEKIQSEYDKQVRVNTIDECIKIAQKIKDDYNDSKFGEQKPINYETICGIIIGLQRLKESE